MEETRGASIASKAEKKGRDQKKRNGEAAEEEEKEKDKEARRRGYA